MASDSILPSQGHESTKQLAIGRCAIAVKPLVEHIKPLGNLSGFTVALEHLELCGGDQKLAALIARVSKAIPCALQFGTCVSAIKRHQRHRMPVSEPWRIDDLLLRQQVDPLVQRLRSSLSEQLPALLQNQLDCCRPVLAACIECNCVLQLILLYQQ